MVTVYVIVPMPSFTLVKPVSVKVGVPSLSVMVPVPVTKPALRGVEAPSTMVSFGSLMVSLVVGIRVIKLVLPAGTLTVGPVTVVNVVPPSNETSIGVPVSVPKRPLPLAGVKVTIVGVVDALLKVTV